MIKLSDPGIIITGVLFIVSIIFGIRTSKLGRPLSKVVFTVHKVSAVAAIIFAIIIVSGFFCILNPGLLEMCLLVFCGSSIILSFITGVLLSFDKPVNELVLNIHKVASLTSVIILAVTIYMLAFWVSSLSK